MNCSKAKYLSKYIFYNEINWYHTHMQIIVRNFARIVDIDYLPRIVCCLMQMIITRINFQYIPQ